MEYFPPFHFWQNRQEKSLLRYSRKKKRRSRLKKQEAKKKSKNWPFPKGFCPWFWSKNGIFSTFSILANRKEKSLAIFYKEKMPFQTIKTRSKKNRKISLFPKGLVHGFGQKMGFSPALYLVQNSRQKVSGNTPERKKALQII